jgi:MgtE-like protein
VVSGRAASTTHLDMRDFVARPGEAALAADVLDRQLVDIDGARVVRANDLYLATVAEVVRLVGLDVGAQALLRRLGPSRWRTRPTPDAVIDWASVHSFEPGTGPGRVRLARHRGELNRLRPAELADLLEDLGRAERRQLLDVVERDTAADAVEEMTADTVHQLFTESDPSDAADLLAHMEPDEAADALRELDDTHRDQLLDRMPSAAACAVRVVLDHDAGTAGGIMTPVLIPVVARDRVADLRHRLRAQATHVVDLDGGVVVDDAGRLIDDVSFGELLLAEPDTTMAALIGEPWPVVATVDTPR